jgi:hypothetical protein
MTEHELVASVRAGDGLAFQGYKVSGPPLSEFNTASRSRIGSLSPPLASSNIRLATIVTAGSLRLTRPSAFRVSSNAVVRTATSSGVKAPLPKRTGRIGITPTPERVFLPRQRAGLKPRGGRGGDQREPRTRVLELSSNTRPGQLRSRGAHCRAIVFELEFWPPRVFAIARDRVEGRDASRSRSIHRRRWGVLTLRSGDLCRGDDALDSA